MHGCIKPVMYNINGTRKNLKELSIEYGINYNTLYARINRQGMPLEKALTMPLKKQLSKYEVDGVVRGLRKTVEYLQDTSKPYLTYETVRGRLRSGWTPDEALELVPRVKKEKKKRYGKYKDKGKQVYVDKFCKFVKEYGVTQDIQKYREAKRIYRRLMEREDLNKNDLDFLIATNKMIDTWRKQLKAKRLKERY